MSTEPIDVPILRKLLREYDFKSRLGVVTREFNDLPYDSIVQVVREVLMDIISDDIKNQ